MPVQKIFVNFEPTGAPLIFNLQPLIFNLLCLNTMNENFLKMILERKSVRRYADKPIEREKLETLCRAALAAPSARNQQMRELIVLTERAGMDALIPVLPNAPMLKNAAAAIVVNGVLDNEWSVYWQQDCSASVENILLAAEALGLGACWCGLYPREERALEVAKMLGVPETQMPMALITLGYPLDATERVKDKWKPEKIHWEKF